MTLIETMRIIKQEHGFKASSRKWKDKLKEWKFDKYLIQNLTETEKGILVAKAAKRKLEGKDTVFYYGGTHIHTFQWKN